MGIKEQLIFPEIDYDKIDKVRGMDICFVTTAKTDEEARELFSSDGRSVLRSKEGSIVAKKSMKVKQARTREVFHPGNTTGAKSAAGRMPIFASTAVCRICFQGAGL